MRRPRRLFETPPKWGNETYYLSRHEAEKVARVLRRELGWHATLGDCRVWYRVGPDLYEEPRSGARSRFRFDQSSRSWVPASPQVMEGA